MTIFTCSDTFEGILCGVYDAWMSKLGHANVKLEIENRGNIQMFAQYRTVEVTSEKTEKVISAICKKAGDQIYEQVYRAFLSGEEEKADAIYKVYVAIPKEDEEKLTTKELVGHLRFEPEYLMFQPDNKRGGIIKMMEHLNADIKDVVVFGDDYNDMDMFCPEWFSIAMGNACQDLKDIANYVTDSNVDDGIKNACEHFGWI
mgnify:CR=1 FL=1